MPVIKITLAGEQLSLDMDRASMERRLRSVEPDLSDHALYFIVVDDKRIPVKQALQALSGKCRLLYNTTTAIRTLQKLGLRILDAEGTPL
jgi:hypothetical protein